MTASTRRRPQFHPLTVSAVERLTDDAVAVTFDVPEQLAEDYRFAPGQALTLRRADGDRDDRRSYSICAPVGAPPRVGVREVPGGFFSSWLGAHAGPGGSAPPGWWPTSPPATGSRCCRPQAPSPPTCRSPATTSSSSPA